MGAFILGLLVGGGLAWVVSLFVRTHDAWLLRQAVFYGPYTCLECGRMICESSFEDGRKAYDYPEDGPIYPNTRWNRHECAATDYNY
jgi:hypothetical protein